MATIAFTDAALDDLRRLGPAGAGRALVHLLGLEREPDAAVPLVDPSTGYRILTRDRGRWRAVCSVADDHVTVHEVWVTGVRLDGEAYEEALDRMQSADPPDLVELARALRRLSRITGVAPIPPDRVRSPVPDWLADALVERAGISRLDLATMDARAAFDAWNALGPLGATT